MSLSQILIGLVVVAFIVILILFPGARSLVKGFIGIFIKDLASTPEGAEAIYNEKIDDAQKKYNIAHDALAKASGRVASTERDLNNAKARLADVESQCEALVKSNNLEAAQLKVEEREDILSEIDRLEKLLKAYQSNKRDAQEAFETFEKQLRDIKREAKRTVENMKVKKQLKEAYDEMDELKKTTEADKLLEHVREKNKELDEQVIGARTIHENKLSTKLSRAEQDAKKVQTNAYLESLKTKYNVGGTSPKSTTTKANVPSNNKRS